MCVEEEDLKTKKAEVINRNRESWYLTHSIELARNFSKECGSKKMVYRLPNGVYAVRKTKKKC